ncbi:MAG: multicopper oxidase domain-containing protein [Chloroflexi bacterium]|nr:multicopper oxidase domain-containing protein [Chloroflexota bacterium]
MPVTRREFIRYAMVGAAAFAGGAVASRAAPWGRPTQYGAKRRLAITEAMVQMVDRSFVYHWAFEDLDNVPSAPQMPGPLLQAEEGEEMQISVTNNLPGPHGFRILGAPGEVGAGIVIPPGETREIDFEAPAGGSYMYFDHLNAPVNRVLGLHGPVIVLPARGNTPYGDPSPSVQKLFDDLGTTAHFPGEPWKAERTRIWVLNTIDPRFHEMARNGRDITASQLRDELLPRYFTINGEAGAYASHNHHTTPSGRIGQPFVIRIMNAGLADDSLHIHGNHVYLLARTDEEGNRRVEANPLFIDTFRAEAGTLMDWLLPMRRPPDIPGDERVPLRELIARELSLTLGGVPQSPIEYPMHDHNEVSQSAAGGNYPQGMVTHWEITGDIDGVDFPQSDLDEKGGRNEEYERGEGGHA